MKEIIIDTNILYYWSDLETNTKFPCNEFNKYSLENKIFISTPSLLEMFVHYHTEPNKILKGLEHIKNNKIEIIDFEGTIKPAGIFEDFMNAVKIKILLIFKKI